MLPPELWINGFSPVALPIYASSEAVTPMTGLMVLFVAFTILYISLAGVVFYLLRRQVFASPLILPEPEKPVEQHPAEAQHVTS